MMFLSFPFAWTLFYGQIDGLVVGGLALAWWAMEKEKPLLVGAGLILASIKPQMALPLGIAIWWWSRPRWKALVVPALVLAASFIQWGFWIPVWFQNLFQTDDLVLLSRNISLWTLAGPWIWLVWIPILLALRAAAAPAQAGGHRRRDDAQRAVFPALLGGAVPGDGRALVVVGGGGAPRGVGGVWLVLDLRSDEAGAAGAAGLGSMAGGWRAFFPIPLPPSPRKGV